MNRKVRGIALCGYMGCGKSVTGEILAGLLGLDFKDLDHCIEDRGQSIADIFAAHGEDGFRQLESEILAECVQTSEGGILALGGGAVLSQKNRKLLADNRYHTLFLRAPLWMLWSRVSADGSRPLTQSGYEAFCQRYRDRLPIYRSLDTIVDAYPGTPETVAQRICFRSGSPRLTHLAEGDCNAE